MIETTKTAAEISREFRHRFTTFQKWLMGALVVATVIFLVMIVLTTHGVINDKMVGAITFFYWVITPIFCIALATQVVSLFQEGKAIKAYNDRVAALMARRYKIYTVVSREAMTKMGDEVGKMFAQGGHAALHAWWDSKERFPLFAHAYRDSQHAFKITLVVDTDAELEALYDTFKPVCGVSLVRDAGFTVFKEPTITCLGIGPLADEDRGALDNLKTLRPVKSK